MALITNCEAYWKMENRTDEVGSNDLTNSGASVVAGKINNCYSFDGDTDEMKSDDNNYFNDTTFSISFWIKFDYTTDNRYFVALDHSGDGWGLRTETNESHGADAGNRICLVLKGTATIPFNSTTFTTGTWEHYVLTYNDGSAQILYKNGVADSESSASTIDGTTKGLVLGTFEEGNTENWAGDLDEIGYWSRVLTSAEVTSLYNSGSGLTYPFTTTTATRFQINKGDVWKDVEAMQINIGDVWKDVKGVQVNIGDTWKEVF